MNTGNYVDTEQMENILTSIEGHMNDIEEAINAYSPTADSLGSSSFRGKVETNLTAVKDSYLAMIPLINEIRDIIAQVISAYDLKIEDIKNTDLVVEE